MPIALSCNSCEWAYRLKDELAGKRIRSDQFETVFSVPTDEELDAASAVEYAELISESKLPVAGACRPGVSLKPPRSDSVDDEPAPRRRKKWNRPRRDRLDDRRYRGGGIHIGPGVVYGAALMISAVAWLVVG